MLETNQQEDEDDDGVSIWRRRLLTEYTQWNYARKKRIRWCGAWSTFPTCRCLTSLRHRRELSSFVPINASRSRCYLNSSSKLSWRMSCRASTGYGSGVVEGDEYYSKESEYTLLFRWTSTWTISARLSFVMEILLPSKHISMLFGMWARDTNIFWEGSLVCSVANGATSVLTQDDVLRFIGNGTQFCVSAFFC